MVGDNLDKQAASAGIDSMNVVREGLIDLRDRFLETDRWEDTVLLTHAVWWFSLFKAVVEESGKK
jgi:hypothetical protein